MSSVGFNLKLETYKLTKFLYDVREPEHWIENVGSVNLGELSDNSI